MIDLFKLVVKDVQVKEGDVYESRCLSSVKFGHVTIIVILKYHKV